MHTKVFSLEDKGYEYTGVVAARYPGFTASEWGTNYETEAGARYRVIATKFTRGMVEMLCRTRYPRYRAAYTGFTPYTFVVQHGVKDFT